jgi:hypothetical protein
VGFQQALLPLPKRTVCWVKETGNKKKAWSFDQKQQTHRMEEKRFRFVVVSFVVAEIRRILWFWSDGRESRVYL